MTGQSSSTALSPADLLKEELLGLFRNAENDPSAWFAIWSALLRNDWFVVELRRRATANIPPWRRDPDRVTEVEHEAILILAETLQRNPDLGVDYARVDATFTAWMGTIIENAVKKALHRLSRDQRWNRTLEGEEADWDAIAWDPEIDEREERAVKVGTALEQLDDPARTVLMLNRKHTLAEVAGILKLSYWQVHYIYRQGKEQLRRALEADAD